MKQSSTNEYTRKDLARVLEASEAYILAAGPGNRL